MAFKKATVKSSRVPSTQSNFPVYVDLKRLNGGTSMTTAEANSIRVYANESKTTEWAREIVSVDEMHVKVPSLTSTTDIYVDWDGSRSDYGVTDTYGRNNVWSDYKAVYHLESLTNDSTSNGYTLTNSGSVTSGTGKIEGCADFGQNNSSKYLLASSNMGITTGSYSLSMWIKLRTEISSGGWSFINHESTTGSVGGRIYYVISSGTRSIYFVRSRFSIADDSVIYNKAMGTTNFYHLVVTYDGTTVTGYFDGVSVGTKSSTGNGTSGGTNGVGLSIGNNGAPAAYNSSYTDEVRITSSTLSANWITTEYNNQNDEADFWGTWTDAGGSPAVAKGGILLAW
jgi:hypothetical protein